MTTAYLIDLVRQVGYEVRFLYMDDIGYDTEHKIFTGIEGESLRTVFKLYPYEWMVHEEFGLYLIESLKHMHWIEPIWKMLLSNKMILKVLWDLFPNHPNLLPASVEPLSGRYVKKSLFAREGANVEIIESGKVLQKTAGEYGEEGFVYQQFFQIPDHQGHIPVIGSWLIGGEPARIGIREASSLVTQNNSLFVPHYFY